jgi:hypothetical protein
MTSTTRIDLRVKSTEKERMESLALKSGCSSLSSYIRHCALNKPVKTQLDSDLVLELLKMNADLSRLGNLLRLTLKTHQGGYTKEQLKHIEDSLKHTTQLIKLKVEQL